MFRILALAISVVMIGNPLLSQSTSDRLFDVCEMTLVVSESWSRGYVSALDEFSILLGSLSEEQEQHLTAAVSHLQEAHDLQSEKMEQMMARCMP